MVGNMLVNNEVVILQSQDLSAKPLKGAHRVEFACVYKCLLCTMSKKINILHP